MILTKKRKKVSNNLSEHRKKESHKPLIINGYFDKRKPKALIDDGEVDAHQVSEHQVSPSLPELGILATISRKL